MGGHRLYPAADAGADEVLDAQQESAGIVLGDTLLLWDAVAGPLVEGVARFIVELQVSLFDVRCADGKLCGGIAIGLSDGLPDVLCGTD